MRCPPSEPTFRLLDAFVGWDGAAVEGLTSPDELPGVSLVRAGGSGLTENDLAPYLPPPRLAPGCDRCEWYLATPVPPAARLLHRSRCSHGWQPTWSTARAPADLAEPMAVAAAGHRVAVADRGRGRVLVWAESGSKLVAAIPFPDPAVVAFGPDGDIWVAGAGSTDLAVFDPGGLPRRVVTTGLAGPVVRLGFGPTPGRPGPPGCDVWVVTDEGGELTLWRATGGSLDFAPADLDELAASLAASTLHVVTDRGFCLQEPSVAGIPAEACFDWFGRPVAAEAVGGAALAPLTERGQLLTAALDSGLPRCRWHRVRVDADVPDGTTIEIAVATSEVPDPPAQGHLRIDPGWSSFVAGVPHPDDWQQAPDGALDFLVQQPPGRYLFLRMRMRGDGRVTPLARRIRLDFPRATSLDSLPAIYGQDPAAEDFTERFLSLFDASIADLDRHIARHPALIDADGVPESALPWLADFVGLAFAPEWDVARRRAVVAAAPHLYRERGTPEGLARAVELVFGVRPVIEELGPARAWGAVAASGAAHPADARLRSVRLFSSTRARVRLGSSALSTAPVKSYGNPDHDARTAGAFRIRVLVPREAGGTPLDRARMRRLVATQAPAHTVAEVRFGGDGLVVGAAATVGVDTALAPLPAPVLGGNVRLGRQTVLWPSRRGRAPGVRLDAGTAVGVSTLME